MPLPFGSGSGSSGDTSHLGRGGEDAEINGTQGGAPGGRWPQDDLPMNAAPGNAQGWTEGFNPTADQGANPIDNTQGTGLTPAMPRR